jgi:hypothetical protein
VLAIQLSFGFLTPEKFSEPQTATLLELQTTDFVHLALMINKVSHGSLFELGVVDGFVCPIGVILEDVSDSDDSSDTSSIFEIDDETKKKWEKAFEEDAPDPDK